MKFAKRLSMCLISAAIACKSAGGPSAPPGVTTASITVTSTSFPSGGTIPVDFTCDGKDQEPALAWSAVPEATKSLAIVIDDPDAPSGTFTHLIAFNGKADAHAVAEGADPSTIGATLGQNDFGSPGYRGPCPPKGQLHHYRFSVYALDATLSLFPPTSRAQLDAALSGHVLGQGTLTGTFAH